MANARELVQIILFNGQALFSNKLFDPELKDMAGKPGETSTRILEI